MSGMKAERRLRLVKIDLADEKVNCEGRFSRRFPTRHLFLQQTHFRVIINSASAVESSSADDLFIISTHMRESEQREKHVHLFAINKDTKHKNVAREKRDERWKNSWYSNSRQLMQSRRRLERFLYRLATIRIKHNIEHDISRLLPSESFSTVFSYPWATDPKFASTTHYKFATTTSIHEFLAWNYAIIYGEGNYGRFNSDNINFDRTGSCREPSREGYEKSSSRVRFKAVFHTKIRYTAKSQKLYSSGLVRSSKLFIDSQSKIH